MASDGTAYADGDCSNALFGSVTGMVAQSGGGVGGDATTAVYLVDGAHNVVRQLTVNAGRHVVPTPALLLDWIYRVVCVLDVV